MHFEKILKVSFVNAMHFTDTYIYRYNKSHMISFSWVKSLWVRSFSFPGSTPGVWRRDRPREAKRMHPLLLRKCQYFHWTSNYIQGVIKDVPTASRRNIPKQTHQRSEKENKNHALIFIFRFNFCVKYYKNLITSKQVSQGTSTLETLSPSWKTNVEGS